MIWVCTVMGWTSVAEADTFEEAVEIFKGRASTASLLETDIEEAVAVDMGDGDGIREATPEDIAWYEAMTAPIKPKPLTPQQKLERALRGKAVTSVGFVYARASDLIGISLMFGDDTRVDIDAMALGEYAVMDIDINGMNIEGDL